jgi:hypothetical protein
MTTNPHLDYGRAPHRKCVHLIETPKRRADCSSLVECHSGGRAGTVAMESPAVGVVGLPWAAGWIWRPG